MGEETRVHTSRSLALNSGCRDRCNTRDSRGSQNLHALRAALALSKLKLIFDPIVGMETFVLI